MALVPARKHQQLDTSNRSSLLRCFQFRSDTLRSCYIYNLPRLVPLEEHTMSNDVSTYYILASSVVFWYDFVLTMPQEIKYIWSSKLNLMNSPVIVLRYITVLGYIPVFLLAFVPVTNSDACFRNGKWPGIIGIICQGLTLAFLIIRLFAIYDKRRWILYVTVPFGLLNIILSCLALGTSAVVDVGGLVMTGETEVATFISCFALPNFGTNESPLLFKISYISIILFDTFIFLLAIARMGKMYRAKRLHRPHSSIISILLRDGTILYAILAISNISSFVFFMLFIDGTEKGINFDYFLFVVSSGTNSEMTHVLSVILVSRMIFNLREAGTEVHEGTMEWHSRIERETATMQLSTFDSDVYFN